MQYCIIRDRGNQQRRNREEEGKGRKKNMIKKRDDKWEKMISKSGTWRK
jgi:hypothetical protein